MAVKIIKQSPRLEFNQEDMTKIGKGFLIMLAGTTLTYLTDTISMIEWGEYKPIIVGLSAVLINAAWKLLKGK